MIRAFVFGAALMLCMVGDHAILAQNRPDLCPPRFRRDPVATNQAREAKKAEMRRRGFPERLLHLLDREECVACVEMASDSFHITVVYHDDDRAPVGASGGRIRQRGFEWDPQTERRVREWLTEGRIKAFYILNTATRCRCCGDDDRPDSAYADWNEELDLHMGQTIGFDDPRDLGPLPPDLVSPPRGWLERVPGIEQFDKPPKRVVQVLCRACQSIADRWNSAADTLDSLWNRKVNLLEGISITRNAIVTRRNQIARLEYSQLFTATESAANQREIDRLKEVNEGQGSSIDRDERRLEEIERSIAEQQQRMDAIMKELLACEEKCKTTATATDAQTAVTPSTPEQQSVTPEQSAVSPTPDQPVVPSTPEQSSPPSPPDDPVSPNTSIPPQTEAAQTLPPDVAADARPQAPVVPGAAQAACPDCTAAAAEVARLNALIAERNAELQRERADLEADAANLENLRQLGANAARRGETTKVAEIDRRIEALKTASREARERMFRLEEAIRQLSDQLEAAKRVLETCNSKCAGAAIGDPTGIGRAGGGAAKRTVAVKPLSSSARCRDCAPLLVQLQQSHRVLEELAQRANDRQLEDDFEAFEEQRVKVADYERQLAECNNKCTTATAGDTTATGGTGTPGPVGTPGGTGTTGTPPVTDVPLILAGRAACPECDAAAAAAARIGADIQARNGELGRLRAEHEINLANLNNLSQLRARAAERPDGKATVADFGRRIAELKDESRSLRTQMFEIEEQVRQLNDELDAAKRALEACNQRCAGYTGAVDPTGTGMTGGGSPKRTVVVKPLSASARCAQCQPLLVQLQQSHASLEQLAQRANDRQLEEDFEAFEEQRAKVADYQRDLAACNQRCAITVATNTAVSPPVTTGTPAAPVTTGTPPSTTGVTGGDPVPAAKAACPECQAAADNVNALEERLTEARADLERVETLWRQTDQARKSAQSVTDQQRLADQSVGLVEQITATAQRVSYLSERLTAARADLERCNARCTTTLAEPPATTGRIGDGGPPLVDVFDPNGWGASGNADVEIRIQIKMTDVFDAANFPQFSRPLNSSSGDADVVIPPQTQLQVREWFNPLGLLARRLVDQIERWRGSMGPRPLLARRDIELAGPYTSGQAMGLPKGVHLLLTDSGGSTGKTLALQVLNLTGKPVRLAPMPFAIEPIRQQAQARVQQAFTRLSKAAPVRLDLSAYCVEFLKLPPAANQIFRLAPANIQKKYEAMSKVLQSASRVQHAGLLRPDSNPAAYTDSIKQWAVWAVEQRLNESRFTDAFLGHTKKNVEAAGQPWSKPAEDMVRKVSPNRWRDILKVLQGAGVPVPQ